MLLAPPSPCSRTLRIRWRGSEFASLPIRSALEIARRGQNCDPLPRMQGQQIGIAGEDQVSLAVQSDFEKLVVFGIAAFPDRIHNWDELGYASKQPQELLAIGETDVAVELGTREHVRQFVH